LSDGIHILFHFNIVSQHIHNITAKATLKFGSEA